jgi:hypothetical protein
MSPVGSYYLKGMSPMIERCIISGTLYHWYHVIRIPTAGVCNDIATGVCTSGVGG